MEPLIARGRARLAAYMERYPIEQRPIGYQTLAVVCREDFEQYAALCLDHVTLNTPTLYVVGAKGALCAIVSPLRRD